MFYANQSEEMKTQYLLHLAQIGALSKLFSESEIPYLYYRAAEKVFCMSFSANDLSRNDISLDAVKDSIGIGLKTYIKNSSFQKIAEFNKDQKKYVSLNEHDMIEKISSLRNRRIDVAVNIGKTKKNVYHCVVREKSKFIIYEEEMERINIANITDIKKVKESSIHFNDGLNEYSFSLSKSTLLKRFGKGKEYASIEINIVEDPFSVLNSLKLDLLPKQISLDQETICLPLYSKKNGCKYIPERSGLNQWNARGRTRDADEVYIPISQEFHKRFPTFFPDRETPFSLILPDQSKLSAKLCQDNSKALMTSPNKDLGKWLLRDILNLNECELVTYEMLEEVGIDSVRITKIDINNYTINFAKLGSYEEFYKLYMKKESDNQV